MLLGFFHLLNIILRENSSGNMQTRFIIVQVDDMLSTTIIVEDKRGQLS